MGVHLGDDLFVIPQMNLLIKITYPVKIVWNLFPVPPPTQVERHLEAQKAIREVTRALNAWLYEAN